MPNVPEQFDIQVVEDQFDIQVVEDLVRAASDLRTMGYDVDFDIQPNLERARVLDGFFLVILTNTNHPDIVGFVGEWWFDADGYVTQVL